MKKTLSITLILAVLVVCLTGCGASAKKVVIASETYTENQILAEVFAQLLEAEGFDVEMKMDMASALAHEAMKDGDIDISPSYTASILTFFYNEAIEPGTSSDETYARARQRFDEVGLAVLPRMGFDNSFSLAVRDDFAAENNIKVMSDLVPFADQLVMGFEHGFDSRPDGYQGMCEHYGFNFKDFVAIDLNLKKESMAHEEIDVTNVYTTDGWPYESGLTVLEDDLSFFPIYDLVPTIRKDTLEKYPEIEEILSVLTDSTTGEEMVYYNNMVDIEGMEASEAASLFIKDLSQKTDG